MVFTVADMLEMGVGRTNSGPAQSQHLIGHTKEPYPQNLGEVKLNSPQDYKDSCLSQTLVLSEQEDIHSSPRIHNHKPVLK